MNGAHARAARRVRLLLMLGMLAVLALGSFWVSEVMRRQVTNGLPNTVREDPDYFIEKFVFVKMSKTGNVRYDIAGAKLMHFPRNDSYEIQQPVLNSRSNPQSPLSMRAEKAIVDDDNNKIHMQHKVQMDRPESAFAEHFHLDSEYMLIHPDDEQMETDQPVEMALGLSRLSGIGMSFNNATREIRVLHQASGKYVVAQQEESNATLQNRR